MVSQTGSAELGRVQVQEPEGLAEEERASTSSQSSNHSRVSRSSTRPKWTLDLRLGGGVESRVAWVGEQRAGDGCRTAGIAAEVMVADEPLLVVDVVVNLVWQDAGFQHLLVIDAGGCQLAPCGVFVAVELGVDMASHGPHVRDDRSEWWAGCIGAFSKNLLAQCID